MAQDAAERQLEILSGKGGVGRAARQHRPFDHDCVITKLGHRTQIVSRDQHRAPLIAQFAQQVDDAGLGFHVYAGERFIQQNDLSVTGDGARQKNTFFCPPESSPICRWRYSSISTRASAASTH